MPIGRYYKRGILISEEEIELESRDRQMRLEETATEDQGPLERSDKPHRARG